MDKTFRSPLKAKKFLEELHKYFEAWKGTYLYEICIKDHSDKITAEGGYPGWLEKLLNYLLCKYNLKGKTVIDVGCGTGELTVWMNKLGYSVHGVEIQEELFNLSKILASENGLSEETFIFNSSKKLPFEDKSVDMITMFSVLEHIGDAPLKNILIPEFLRICRGVIFILVPNKLKRADDHTGLWFVPMMPEKIAEKYVKLRGKRYRYFISASGKWDVHYRSWRKIKQLFGDYFEIQFVPDEIMNPAGQKSFFGKKLKIASKEIPVGFSIPSGFLNRVTGYPEKSFYELLNFVLVPKK